MRTNARGSRRRHTEVVAVLAIAVALGGLVASCAPSGATYAPSPSGASSNEPTRALRDRPSARDFHALVHEPHSGLVFLEGGLSGDPFIQDLTSIGLVDTLWAYDPSSNDWQVRQPAPPGEGPVVADPGSGDLLKIVGIAPPFRPTSETWRYDVSAGAWSRLTTELAPYGRLAARAAVDPSSRAVVLFGGATADWEMLDETWAFDLDADRWREMSPDRSPPPRFYHLTAYDSIRDRIMVWGGDVLPEFAQRPYLAHLTSADYEPMWAFDIDTDTWTEMQPVGPVPPLRVSGAMVYDPSSDRLIVHGGESFNGGQAYGDTWAYDPATRTWTLLADDGPVVTAHDMVLLPDRGEILLFGGRPGDVRGQVTDELWRFDLATLAWSPIVPGVQPG